MSSQSSSSESESETDDGFHSRKQTKKMFKWMQKNVSTKNSDSDQTNSLSAMLAQKTLGLEQSDQTTDSTYGEILERKSSETLFQPLRQPYDRSRVVGGKFLRANLTLQELIDPKNYSKKIKNTYSKEIFTHFRSLAEPIEGKRNLLRPLSSLETTFTLASIMRISEAYQVLSKFSQIALCSLNEKAFKDKKQAKYFQQSMLRAMNSIVDDLNELTVVVSSPKQRSASDYQKNLLKTHNQRLRDLPVTAARTITGKVSHLENSATTKAKSTDIQLDQVKISDENYTRAVVNKIRQIKPNFLKVPAPTKNTTNRKRNFRGRGRGRGRGRARGRRGRRRGRGRGQPSKSSASEKTS